MFFRLKFFVCLGVLVWYYILRSFIVKMTSLLLVRGKSLTNI